MSSLERPRNPTLEGGAKPSGTARSEAAATAQPAGTRWADLGWGLALVSVITLLVLHHFAWGGGSLSRLDVGPLRLSSFGLLAALDLLFGVYLIRRWCLRFDLDWPALRMGLVPIMGLGFFLSHLVSVVFYHPGRPLDLAAILDLRSGISSFGGMFGGGLVAVLFLRRRGLPVWRYADPLVYGFVGGYVFGRAGCFAVHDHPGVASDFFLAVDIDGVRRHDLGFYELWLMLGLFVAISLLARRRRPPDGAVLALAVTLYAPIRFLFDFLRIGDVTYGGLTPGQWFAVPLFAVGLWGFVRLAGWPRRAGGCRLKTAPDTRPASRR